MPCLFQGNQIPGIYFPHFPTFGNTRKVGQRKVFSGQRKKLSCIVGKCFPFHKERKTLSIFTTNISLGNTSSNLSFSGLFPKTTEARRIDL